MIMPRKRCLMCSGLQLWKEGLMLLLTKVPVSPLCETSKIFALYPIGRKTSPGCGLSRCATRGWQLANGIDGLLNGWPSAPQPSSIDSQPSRPSKVSTTSSRDTTTGSPNESCRYIMRANSTNSTKSWPIPSHPARRPFYWNGVLSRVYGVITDSVEKTQTFYVGQGCAFGEVSGGDWRATDDIFFEGQPEQVKNALGDMRLTSSDELSCRRDSVCEWVENSTARRS